MGFAQFIARDPEARREVQLDFAAASPFHLNARDVAAEGILVPSYRDLCAGKLHAIRDRYEPRDYVDLYAILTRSAAGAVGESEVRRRFRALVADLVQTDPGLDASLVGSALGRALGRPVVERLPYLLFIAIEDPALQHTIEVCREEAALITLSELA